MHQFDSALTKFENVFAGGTLVLATILAAVQVALRPFGVFLFWSEEAIIYLIIFSTFIGAAATLRDREHVNVDVVATFLGARGKQVMGLIAGVVTLVYLAVIGYLAWMLIFEPFSSSTLTPALHLPLWTMELAVAIGLTLMFIRGIQFVVDVARHGMPDNAVEEALEAEAANIGLDVDAIRNVGDGGTRGAGGVDHDPRTSFADEDGADGHEPGPPTDTDHSGGAR
ncbi:MULTISPECIES: TRAP transporter small permease [unclassified Janibacter]|uniref:TRAP transporter small permease n=1 Tax=unclassified Janibacter TaxID=2649294 RepID=UPI003D00DD6E